MPSKIWSISTELKASVPLKSRCSRKCEFPACSGASLREPTPIQNPSAIDRTEGMASVTTRTPESSSVSLCPSAANRRLLPPVARVPGGARPAAALAAVTPAAVASVTPAAISPAASARPVATPAAISRAHRRDLLGRLALDLGIVRQAQPDPAALAIDLHDAHGHLVAAVEHALDGLRTLAGRDVRDVEQPVGALRELDERAERGGLHDLGRRELVADLDLLGHGPDPLDQGVALLAARRVDEHRPVVLHVDLRVELLGEGADRLAALADDHADLLGIDLDRGDPRRVGRQL